MSAWTGYGDSGEGLANFTAPDRQELVPEHDQSLTISLTDSEKDWRVTVCLEDLAMCPAAENNTVLVVDDEPNVRSFVRTVLLRHGYEAVEAEDGVAAYELLRRLSGGIQLRVTDVQMPRMDGITLGEKVSTDYPKIEVLYISGFVSKPPKHIPSGRFLPKPFRPDVLVRCVQDLCAG